MFPNLNAKMARKKLTMKALSELSGIPYESMKNKCSGATEFKRVEMYTIKKKVFPECTIDYLFATEEVGEMEDGKKKHPRHPHHKIGAALTGFYKG